MLERREAAAEPALRSTLERVVSLLDQIRTHGRKLAPWIEASTAPESETRALAFAQLGRIGSAEAVHALEQAFGSAEREDRLEVLRALGGVRAARAGPLLERVLLGEEFDHPHETDLRAMAAWSALRIGGEGMWELLASAARRREGRDAKVLVYAALLGGQRAVPLLAELRRPRMRFLGWPRGKAQERLDWLAARLAIGRSVRRIDVPPELLAFR